MLADCKAPGTGPRSSSCQGKISTPQSRNRRPSRLQRPGGTGPAGPEAVTSSCRSTRPVRGGGSCGPIGLGARAPCDGAVVGGPVRESSGLFSLAVCAHKRPRSEYSRLRAGPAARTLTPSPKATNGANCATRRGAWVTGFDCGAGSYVLGVIPPARWTRLNVINRAGVLALVPARVSLRFFQGAQYVSYPVNRLRRAGRVG